MRVTASGGRAWVGQMRPRTFTLGMARGPADPPLEASVVFLQRPRIAWWVFTLLGFLLAAAVFALVLDRAFGGVIDKTKLDARVVEQAFKDGSARPATIPVTPASVGGRLLASTSTEANPIGVGGIQVNVFSVDDPVVAEATAVTDEEGNFTVGGLKEGEYLLQFAGAGFDPVWYPGSDTAAEATPVTATTPKPGAPPPPPLAPVTIGGQPGSVAGVLTGGDPVGAVADARGAERDRRRHPRRRRHDGRVRGRDVPVGARPGAGRLHAGRRPARLGDGASTAPARSGRGSSTASRSPCDRATASSPVLCSGPTDRSAACR